MTEMEHLTMQPKFICFVPMVAEPACFHDKKNKHKNKKENIIFKIYLFHSSFIFSSLILSSLTDHNIKLKYTYSFIIHKSLFFSKYLYFILYVIHMPLTKVWASIQKENRETMAKLFSIHLTGR